MGAQCLCKYYRLFQAANQKITAVTQVREIIIFWVKSPIESYPVQTIDNCRKSCNLTSTAIMPGKNYETIKNYLVINEA